MVAQLSSDLARGGELFRANTEAINNQITSLNNIQIAGLRNERQEEEQQRQKELLDDIYRLEEEKNEIRQDRAKIIENQDEIRRRNLADIFKDYLPTPEEMDKKQIPKTEQEAIVALAKESIEIYRKVLGEISGGLKYSHLADARIALEKLSEQKTADIQEKENKLEDSKQVTDDINNVTQINIERSKLISEAEKSPLAWSCFSKELTKRQELIEETGPDSLDKLIKEQKEFLDSVAVQF